MTKRTLIHWFSLSGFLAFLFYFMHLWIGQSLYPGYNWAEQAVSDLSARNAPSFFVASSLSSIYSLFACICCLMLTLQAKSFTSLRTRIGIYLYTLMNFISFIGYSLFPLSESGYGGSFSDIMHVYVVTLSVVLLSISSLVLIILGSLHEKRKGLAIISMIILILLFIGALGTGMAPKSYFGLFERFSLFSIVFYTMFLGFLGFLTPGA